MIPGSAITLLLATLAAAAPSRRQSEPNLSVSLTHTVLAVTEQFNASTDGTAVPVASTLNFDLAIVECREICIPEFHCTLHDKELTAFATLAPGRTQISPARQVGLVTCGLGLPADNGAAQGDTVESRGNWAPVDTGESQGN